MVPPPTAAVASGTKELAEVGLALPFAGVALLAFKLFWLAAGVMCKAKALPAKAFIPPKAVTAAPGRRFGGSGSPVKVDFLALASAGLEDADARES
jgi:hypothetical protein